MTLIFTSPSQSRIKKDKSQKLISWVEKLIDKEKNEQKRNQGQADVRKIIFDAEIEQTQEEKGIADAIKNHANKTEKNRQKLEDMVSNSNRILLKISSVFPWDLFPTKIVIEETRVTIIHRQFFSSQVHSVDIKNISNIFIDSSILFSQLTIVSDTFVENQIIINKLWKEEAVYVRRIIEGLRMFINHDINTTSYETEELISKLKELSTTGIVM